MADREGLGVGVFVGVDDYRYFLVVYTRFSEEDGVGVCVGNIIKKVFLLLHNFSGHQVPNVGTCLRVTRYNNFYLRTLQVVFNLWRQALLHLSRHNIESW